MAAPITTKSKGFAPVNQLPVAQKVLADQSLALTGLRVSDADAGNSSMSVTLSVAHGSLQVTLMTLLAGPTVTYSSNGSRVVISGSQTDINAALNSLIYTPTPLFSGSDTLTMTSSDRGSTSGIEQTDTDVLAITVLPVNHAPLAADRSLTTLEDTALVLRAVDFGFRDVDGHSLASVKITALPQAGSLVYKGVVLSSLRLAAGIEITAADLTAGKLVFIPAKDAYDNPVSGKAYTSFQFQLRDNGGIANGGVDLSKPATFTINVLPVNDAPIAGNDSAFASPVLAASGNVLSNDSDPEGDKLLVNGVGVGAESVKQTLQAIPSGESGANIAGKYGMLHINADGSYSYQVMNTQAYRDLRGGSAVENFTYSVSDGHGGTDKATLAITVTRPNNGPVANDDSSAPNTNAFTGKALSNDTDADGDRLVVTKVGAGRETDTGLNSLTPLAAGQSVKGVYGTLSMKSDGSYSYAVDARNENYIRLGKDVPATDYFTYEVSDGRGGFDRATIILAVRGVNEGPVAVNDRGVEGRYGNVLLNDSDIDRDAFGNLSDKLFVARAGAGLTSSSGVLNAPDLPVTAVTGKYGTLLIRADGSYYYTPDPKDADYRALAHDGTYTETFTYEVSDGKGGSQRAQLVLAFSGPNEAPVAVDDSGASGYVLSNDDDLENDPMTVVAAGAGTEASNTLNTLTAVLPATTSDASAGAPLSQGASGPTGATGADITGTYGTLHIEQNGSYSYTLNPDAAAYKALGQAVTATDAFTYEVSDGRASDRATIRVNVTGINDTPDATDDTARLYRDDNGATGNVLSNDSDVDVGDSISVSKAGVAGAIGSAITSAGASFAGTYGTLTLKGDGSYSYALDRNDKDYQKLGDGITATDSFSYTLTDTHGATDTATLVVTVTGSNNPPDTVDDTGSQLLTDGLISSAVLSNSGNVLSNDTDPNNDRLSVSSAGKGKASDAPTLTTLIDHDKDAGGTYATPNQTTVTGSYGSLLIKADGSYTYSLDTTSSAYKALAQGSTASDPFTYEANDGKGGTSTATLTLTVKGINDAPVANDDSTINGNVLTNDTDPDTGDQALLSVTAAAAGKEASSPALSVVGATGLDIIGTYGKLHINQDGSHTYKMDITDPDYKALAKDATATESFTYQISDGKGGSDKATLSFVLDTTISTPTLALNSDTGIDDNILTLSDGVTTDTQVNVSHLDSDATWEYQVDTGAWQAGTGTSFNLSEGRHTYTVRQTDLAGNQGTSAPFTAVALTNPTELGLSLVDSTGAAIASTATSLGNARVQVSSDAYTQSWQYRLDRTGEWTDGAAFVNGKAYLDLAEGQHLYQVRKLDVVGNTLSQQQSFTVDTVAAKLGLELKDPSSPGITSEPLATVKGLEGRAQFEMKVDDQPDWSPMKLDHLQFKLQTGTHTYFLRQTDVAGNVSEVGEYTATYVSAIPQPGIRLSSDSGTLDGVTNVATIVVDGLQPGATWEYQIDGIDGPWLAGNAAGTIAMISDGQKHNYAVRQQVNGKYSEPGELFNVVADLLAPNGLTVSLHADTGDSDSDNITKDAVVNISGLEVGTSLEIRVDDGEWVSQGVATTSTTLSLSDGTHSYSFRQTDKAGNTSEVVTRSYTYLDALTTAPTLALQTDSGIEDSITNVAKVNVTLAKQTAWQYQVDGGVWQDGTGTSFNAVAGEHTYVVRQSDVAGNSLLSSELTVTLDTTAPVFTSATSVVVTDPDSERQQLIDTSKVLYTLTATDAGTVQYAMQDSDVFNFNATTGELTFKDPRGYSVTESNTYPVTFVATDIAGNSSTQTVDIKIARTNTSAPAINLAELRSGVLALKDYIQIADAGDGAFYVLRDDFNPATDGTSDYGFYNRRIYKFTLSKVDVSGKPIAGFETTALDLSKDYSGGTPPEIKVSANGSVFVTYGYYQAVLKINADTGGVDTTWGNAGTVLGTDLFDTTGQIYSDAVTIGANGEIYVVGYQSKYPQYDAVARTYNSAGQQVSTLKYIVNDNKADKFISTVLPIGPNEFYAFYSKDNTSQDLALARIKDGAPVTSFGNQGFVTLSSQALRSYDLNTPAMLLDSNGKLVTLFNTSNTTVTVKRFTPSGEPDSSFGNSGVFTLQAAIGEVESDGAGGFYFTRVADSVNTRAALGHVTAQGQLDTEFGTNGYVTLGNMTTVTDIKLSNGELEVLGNITVNSVPTAVATQFTIQGELSTNFGDIALTLTEGNRPIGLLVTLGSVVDADAANINNYNGVSIKIERADGANAQDIFGGRGKLRLAPDGSVVWDGVSVGTFTHEGGSLSLTFNSSATQDIADGVTHAITYTNISQQPTSKVLLRWTVSDNDPAGAKVSTSIQTINITDDLKDAGDARIIDIIGGQSAELTDYIQSNGKTYYLLKLTDSAADKVTHADLDAMFNGGQDTTTGSRTYVAENGMQYKLATVAEINAVLDDTTAVKSDIWKQLSLGKNMLSKTSNGFDSSNILSADQGNAADQHLLIMGRDTPQSKPDSGQGFAIIEVDASGVEETPVIAIPGFKLAQDNGESNKDFLTSNAILKLIGFESTLLYEYSIDGGVNWTSVAAGSGLTLQLPQGTYLKNSIQARQTDLSGFTTTISNTDAYKIDQTIKSISLANDQGLITTDLNTADGRVTLQGLDPARPYEYSLNGGKTYLAGGFITVSGVSVLGFQAPNGQYDMGAIRVRQTDINNFTTSFRSASKFVIDPSSGQGTLTLANDNGESTTDFLTSDGTLVLSGLRINLPYEYSVNGGGSWVTVAAGGNMALQLTQGIYEVGSILVKQTDSTGYTTQLANPNRYNIDTTVRSISILNDQGISTLDRNTADGRVLVNGLDTSKPYQYSVNGGQSYQSGSYVVIAGVNTPSFTLPNGTYATNKISVQQTINGFTTTVKNSAQFVVDPSSGQGALTLDRIGSETATGVYSDSGKLNISGLKSTLPFEYSLNGGQSWSTGTASDGTPFITLPEGVLAANKVLVRQTDQFGFVTQLANPSQIKIDHTVRTVTLANDQGISDSDFKTSDGRIVLKGFYADKPYEYSLDGGKTYLAGGLMTIGGVSVQAFNAPDGAYNAGDIRVRQTDPQGYTIGSRTTDRVQVDPNVGQGKLAIVNDTGKFYGDNVTNDGTIEITGLKANTAWKYSVDGGLTWQNGVTTADTKQRIVVPEGVFAADKIQVMQTDSTGYTTTLRNKAAITIDKTPGSATITLVNDTGYSSTDGTTADGTIKFMVNGLAEGDFWSYTTDRGKTWIDGKGSSQTIVVGNGTYPGYQFNVWIYDLAGNISTAALKDYVVVDNTDTTAPVFTSDANIKLVNSSSGSSLKSPYITIVAKDANTVYYNLSGADAGFFNLGNTTGQLSFKATNGQGAKVGDNYHVTVTATDAFGNSTDQSVSIKVYDSLQIVSKTIGNAREKLGEGVDQVIKFNQNIAFNPNGKIEVTYEDEDYNSITTVLDVTDTSKVVINGDSLIFKGTGFTQAGRYYIGMSSGVVSADSGNAYSVYKYSDGALGFGVSSDLSYSQGFVAKNAPIVSQIDASTAKLGKDGAAVIIGDVNGDGIDDWASSYTLADGNGRTDSGKIYVAFGRTDGLVPNFASIANGVGGFVINGAASGDQAGDRLYAAGDVNGDGYADILIKASAANGGNGKAYVVYGKAGTSAVDLASVEAGSGGKYYTNDVKNGVAALGDINNDGYADIAHGRGDLTRTSSWTQVNYGATSTYKITTKITQPANYLGLIDVALDVGVLINGVLDDPFAGLLDVAGYVSDELQAEEDSEHPDPVKIAILQDNERVIKQLANLPGQELVDFTVNKSGGGSKYVPKDTVYEVVYTIKKTDITTTRYTQTLFDVGEVQVEYGNGGTQTITGNVNGTGFGNEIAALGDINGDGFADYAVTEAGFSDYMPKTSVILGTSNKGDFFTSNLTTERHGLTFIDPRMTKNYVGGGALTALGDVNGDGINDFAIGFDSYGDVATYVVYGKLGLSTVNLSDIANGIGGYQLRAGIASRGTALVTAIGDYNGDGLDDFAVTRNSQYASTVQIYYGKATGKTTSESDKVKGADGFQFYISGADGIDSTNPISAGDINGDGLTDLLVRTEFNGNATFLLGSTTTTLDPRIQSDNVGTAADDTMTATGGDLVLGLAGNDTITASGANVVLGGLGNDRIMIDSSFVTALQSKLGAGGNTNLLARIDGGAGIDILQLTGSANLDLTLVSNKMIDSNNISGRLDNIEMIDLGHDSQANTLSIRLADVLEMGNKNVFNTGSGWANVTGSALSGAVNQTQLVISGNSADTVQLKSGEWSLTGNTVKDLSSNEVYKVYVANGSAAQLYIDTDMKVL